MSQNCVSDQRASSDALFYPEDSSTEKNDGSMISLEDVVFSYSDAPSYLPPAVDHLSLQIPYSQHVAVLGRNGSGKSTFAKLCNVLELPDEGSIFVDHRQVRELEDIYAIRQTCGMVFQNPDNQIVGATVEEDCAFGPENLGLETEEIRERVYTALDRTGLSEMAKRSPATLSGGQKQKLAIAGALAMRPRCLILDEACAMLDPQAGEDFLRFADRLSHDEGLTLVQITHDMEHAMMASWVYILSEGRLIAQGDPRDIFSQPELCFQAGLSLPPHLKLLYELGLSSDAFTEEEVADFLAAQLQQLPGLPEHSRARTRPGSEEKRQALIQVKDLSYAYNRGSADEFMALENLSFEVRKGEIFVICGHSGSGKSTLITHLNGLFKPQQGSVHVLGMDVSDKKNLMKLRRHVGLVFQYPEYQLFEATVEDDVGYGPKQMGFSEEERKAAVRQALSVVGLSDDFLSRSPFDLSGGQKRRVAIAGVLAVNPDILIMDEPAAGLDPESREEMLVNIEKLRDLGKTIIMVTHNMDDAARLADYVAVLCHGQMIALDKPELIFSQSEVLKQSGLNVPASMRLSMRLNERLGTDFCFLSMDQAKEELETLLARGYAHD